MSYKIKKVFLQSKVKAFKFLMDNFQLTMPQAQRWIDKKRLYENGNLVIQKSVYIQGEIEVVVFVPTTKGLLPVFETNDFAVFDKPSGVLVHPTSKDSDYSLLDEVKFLFGCDANIVHRIDKETSGLVVTSKHKIAEKRLKLSFEKQEVKKGYLAIVKGKIEKELFIDAPIYKQKGELEIRLQVIIDERGKPSCTKVIPIRYFKENNTSLVEAIPLTGRQHQIRVHMFHVKHPILGDPIYGINPSDAISYLEGELSEKRRLKITGANRLMLHANWIRFHYNNPYMISSNLCL